MDNDLISIFQLQLEGELNGFFLDPVHMEDVGEPPWVVKNKSNKVSGRIQCK